MIFRRGEHPSTQSDFENSDTTNKIFEAPNFDPKFSENFLKIFFKKRSKIGKNLPKMVKIGKNPKLINLSIYHINSENRLTLFS